MNYFSGATVLGLTATPTPEAYAYFNKNVIEELIAYKYGKTSEVQVQNIEKSLNTIIEQFEEMKKDLVIQLSENQDQQN